MSDLALRANAPEDEPRADAVVPIVRAELHRLLHQFDEGLGRQIGFPAATDFDYGELTPFFDYLLNNVGDPEVDPLFRQHTCRLLLRRHALQRLQGGGPVGDAGDHRTDREHGRDGLW
jgi:hypothetical protein